MIALELLGDSIGLLKRVLFLLLVVKGLILTLCLRKLLLLGSMGI